MEILTQHTFGIKTSLDSLIIREQKYKILPKKKFVRRSDKKIVLNSRSIGVHKMDIPFETVEVNRSRSWLGDGIQCDDINCHKEWTEKVKKYNKELFDVFLKEILDFHKITSETLNLDCYKSILIHLTN